MASRPNRRETFFGLGAGLLAGGAEPVEADPAADPARPAFTLLLVNDIYLMGEAGGRGGFARLNAVVKAERARGTPVLYCHAGDCLSPSPMSALDKGAHIVALHNLAPPDLFVPGNHEFDFGPQVFLERMVQARFPRLAANLRDGAGERLPGFSDSAVFTLGGIRVGVVGIALQASPEKAQTGDLRFGPEIATLEAEAHRLRAQGVDMVIGLAHVARETDLAIRARHSVDILLSGHDHDLFLDYDGRTLVAESSHDAHYVTAIDVTAEIEGKEPARRLRWHPSLRIHDTSTVTPDPETLALVRQFEEGLSRELDRPLGVTDGLLDSRFSEVRVRESSFGDLVADAVRAGTGAAVGLMNGGGIRGNQLYPAGTTLTRRDVLTELPFGNTTVLVELPGRLLRAALENGFLDLGRPSGRYLQLSGLKVTLDPAAPPGRRVVEARVGPEPLDEGRTYRVAANSFMLEGGNDYGMLGQGRVLIGASDGRLLAGEVMDYIQTRAPLPPVAMGRVLLR